MASNEVSVFRLHFQLLSEFENYNLIVGNGNIETLNKEDGYMQINGMSIKSNSTEAINSSLQVDNKTGWIIEGKINELMSGSMEVKDNPKFPGTVKQTISVSIEMRYSSK